jgi:hypothetical protein
MEISVQLVWSKRATKMKRLVQNYQVHGWLMDQKSDHKVHIPFDEIKGEGQYGGECYSEMTHREKVLADNKKEMFEAKMDLSSVWACSPMVGRSSGTLPTRVQILVLAPFPRFSRIYRHYALSGKRRSRQRRGTIGDFGNLQICRCSVLRRCSLG